MVFSLLRKCSLLLLCSLLSSCYSMFYHPSRQLELSPADLGLAYEEQIITAAEVSLHGWRLPAVGETAATVLFLHGNAQNIANHLPAVAWLPQHGFEVFLFDYQGYGQSSGSASPAALAADVRRMITHAAAAAQPGCLFLFGQSLGGTLALYAAADPELKTKLCAVAADSPFADYRSIVRDKLQDFWITYPLAYPLALLVHNGHSPLPRVPDIAPLPLLLIHGEADWIVPVSHSRRLLAQAREPKELWLIAGAPHIQALAAPALQERFSAYIKAAAADYGKDL